MATGEIEHVLVTGNSKPNVFSVAYSPDGRWLAAGGGPGVVKIWDAATGTHLTTLDHPIVDGIESIAFSPDGQWLAAGGDDDTARLWHLESK